MTLTRPRPGTVLVVAVILAFSALMISGWGGERVTGTVSNIGTVLIAAAAGLACLVRAVQRRGRMGIAWSGFGLGALSYAFGEASWAWAETVQGREVPFPGLPDVGYLGMVPLTAAGLLMVPVARQSVANRVRSIVDGLMIACSLLLVSWILVIDPMRSAGAESTLGLYVLLSYPLSDVVLVTVVLYMLALLRRDRQDAGPLMLIGAAMLVIGVADSVYAYATLHGDYASGGLLDIGWFAGFGLVLLAARLPGSGTPVTADDIAETTEQQPFAILVPYAAVLGALICSVVFYAISGRADAFFGNCRSVLILLIVARQMLTLLENRHLTAYLEARVARRSSELQASESRFRSLVLQSSESVAVIDADSTIRFQSDSVERIFGYPAHVLVGLKLIDVAGRRAAPSISAALESIRDQPLGVVVLEVPLRHQDGRVRLAEMTITNVLHDPSVRGYVLNTRDIHDATELQEQLMHEAYHDGLTGLASRALFRERVVDALDRCERTDDVAILVLDLDGFKEVNDSLGHAAGDALLLQVADRLRAAVREGDTVARFGGDEFGVIIESVTARADAEAVGGRIAAALQQPFTVGGRDLHVAVSIGLASAADADDIDQLLRNADLAMYRAKSAGGAGLAAYDPQMLSGLVQRLELEADLRLALERNELALHYQPTVDLRTGDIVGFEALVRWHHPTRGLVNPLDFIGIAEATGLIVPLGRWVLTEACRQAVAWGAGTTRRLKMAVNVSVRQFDSGDLSVMVAEVLAETGMPVDQLCLEMTESVLLTDTDENLTQLQRLKALGVTLAMDDFGTGYSSLAYLRRYPMDILKIDRSFVDRLGGDREDEALVRTIVRLGQSLGMTTVAEGIEDAVQLATLRDLDCDLAQGYFLSRPLPAPDATRILAEGLATKLPVPAVA
ncbi:putative bifunctional diguanylate cyclase/phosphodiesterase [Actinoplanes friuliensis]|uniref:Signaling protein ykoW n=1 Tax=Actinoplanes friuliensis DSM 7358 TaxID=1246995 RepID=U5W0L1_9ACTN|nr:EAL domain-containing protein [Actinoplanes friuliensis]AGZ42644.1 Signaling protein ykoW [Actinoplanes friuliensis DSM 7358]